MNTNNISEDLKLDLISKMIEKEVKETRLKTAHNIVFYTTKRTIQLMKKEFVLIDEDGIFTPTLLSKDELSEMTVKEEKEINVFEERLSRGEKFSCSCMGSYPPNCNCGKFNLND